MGQNRQEIDKSQAGYIKNLKAIIQADSTMSNPFIELQEQHIRIISSPDGKIRVFQWRNSDTIQTSYSHIVQYSVFEGKTRLFSTDYTFLNEVCYDTIYPPLRNGVYLFEGDVAADRRLLGCDISSGVFRKAYPFNSTENQPLYATNIYCSVKEIQNPPHFQLEKDRLMIPEMNGDSIFTGKYSDLYFNGAYFEPLEVKQVRAEKKERAGGKYPKILRFCFKDKWNRYTIEAVDNGIMSIALDISNDSIEELEGETISISLTCDDYCGNCPKIEIPHVAIRNGRYYIENFNVRKQCQTNTNRLILLGKKLYRQRVLDVAGLPEAVPYQRLRYTASRFTRVPDVETSKLVRWALEVDGRIQRLDAEQYHGMQIELEMKEEWLGKEIRVIPYLKKVNRKIAQATTIIDEDEVY
ncbi:MAG: hypothetical protein LBT48_05550 [Prevotellaceae bacterium]|jgi:hypothetical protein|nr:hypothetical protein [Prevotellaceae bacterium]